MEYVAKTNVGKKREKNEDYFLVKTIDDKTAIYVVADGLGGYASGEVASKLACEIIVQNFEIKYSKSCDIKEILKSSVILANEKIFEFEKTDEKYKGMGTTIVILCINEDKVYYTSVGDSRMYHVDKDFGLIKQITEDDTYVNTLLKTNVISESEATNHPQKHMLTKALGIFAKIDVEVFEFEYNVEGYLVICTDGVTNMLDEKEILNLFRKNKFETIAEKIVLKANDKGGTDNITVVIVKI